MRVETILLALPALAAAQQQIPLMDQLKDLYAQATDAVSSLIPGAAKPSSAPYASMPSVSVPNPIDAGASVIADAAVQRLTLENHKTLLVPGSATANPGLEEWMVFVTGGNKTCFGLCRHAETEWNKSTALVASSRNAPHLAMLDCETDPVLCNAWALGPPSLIHMFLPQPLPDQTTPATTVRSIPLNRTSVTAEEITAIHTEEKYKQSEPYEGLWHPFDGPLAKTGVNIPLGWAIWGFSQVPSWMIMVGVSFFSRSIM